MIRDEYKKSQEIRKKSAKEIEGIKKFGERTYYTMTIKKLSNNLKGFNLNTLMMLIMGLVLLVFIVFLLIIDFSLISKGYIIVSLAVGSILIIWGIVWFLIVKRIMRNKIEKYQNLVENLKATEMEKQKSIYKIYSQTTKGEN